MNTQAINLLNRLKNASLSNNELISVPYSKFILDILLILYKEGFIQSFSVVEGDSFKKEISIYLRYYFNKSSLRKLKIVSSPSRVTHLDYNSLSKISIKRNVLFLSTNLGLLTAIECKRKKIGGILLFIC